MDSGFFGFAVLLIGGGILFVGFKIVQAIAASVRQKALDDAAPVLTLPAQVVTKRSQVGGGAGDAASYTIYYATFEFASGERQEYRLKGEEYGLLAEGDRGELTHQGTRYKGFARALV